MSMERLTKRIGNDAVHFDCNGTCGTCDGCTCFEIGGMVDRLATYEDAEDEGRLIVFESAEKRKHIHEFAEADRDGRLVVLPCKVGDKVFVRADTWGNTWNFVTVDCGKFLVGEIIGFVKTRKQTLMKIQVEHNASWKKERKRYPVSALGLTVFLTREAALKAGEPK